VELYTTYFEPYPNLFEPIVRGQQGEDPRALAFAAYSAGDYAEARIQFHKLLVIKKEADVLLLLGNANLILGHDGEAENNFLTILKEFSELHSQAKWYLAMCYLKRGELEKAKIVLKELERPDASYSEKSADLLNQIQ
jgi:tetratricopeptide (TPR) repeat protein